MSDITCDYCGESNGMSDKYFIRGRKPSGEIIWMCIPCACKLATGNLDTPPPFIETPLGEVPIDKQRP